MIWDAKFEYSELRFIEVPNLKYYQNSISKYIFYNTKYKYDFHQSLIFRDRPFPLFWQDEHHQWIFWKGEPVVLIEGDKKIITIILIREEPIVQSAHSSAIGLQKAPPVGCR